MDADDPLFQRFGRTFPKGRVLFREGDPGNEMFVVREGRVAIAVGSGKVEKIVATLGQGELLGELSILSGKPRTATATVVEDARLLVIDPRTFEGMIHGSPEIAVRLIKKLAERLAEADKQIELLLEDAVTRLVRFLAHSAEARGKAAPGGVRVELPLADLLAELGLGPWPLKEAMQKVTRAGVASFQADGFVIPDLGRLEDFGKLLATGRPPRGSS